MTTTARGTTILGTIGLVAMAAVAWLLVLSPQNGDLAEVRDQIEASRSKNDALRVELTKLERQRDQLPQTRLTARALAARFPSTADQPLLFQAVTTAAAQAGVPATDVTELSPAAPVAGTTGDSARLPGTAASTSDLARQAVTVSVKGTYNQIHLFLVNLENISRAYLVSSVTIGSGDKPGTYTATVGGEMFVMPAAPDPATAGRR